MSQSNTNNINIQEHEGMERYEEGGENRQQDGGVIVGVSEREVLSPGRKAEKQRQAIPNTVA